MGNSTVLTFDYELFLGLDSGTAMNSLIKPTNKIISILKNNGAKAIFFVDATYLLTLKRNRHKDLPLIEKQLKEIVSLGSSVELHLHPQWLDAKARENKWSFDTFDRYRLHSLSQGLIENIFDDGVKLLESITGQKVKAFRAGGWSIAPFNLLKNSFINNNIVLDMSVLPGFIKSDLPIHHYDFLKTPGKEYYKFSDNVCIEKENGIFLEVPVTTYEMFGFDLALNNIIKRVKGHGIYGDGKGLESANVKGNKFRRLFSMNMRCASVESQSHYFFKKSLKKIEHRKILSYVMHPKTLCETSLVNFEYLTKKFVTLNTDDLIKECI
jgi:peptidoglycan/xylan/chitin deacetylase (PgdA/CDA1 family)